MFQGKLFLRNWRKKLVEFDKSFSKALDKFTDKQLQERIEKLIIKLEKVETLDGFPNWKKLAGHANYFRLKIGVYRLGFERINGSTIRLISIAHRKDIYKKFP